LHGFSRAARSGGLCTNEISQLLELLFDPIKLILHILVLSYPLAIYSIKILDQTVDIVANNLHRSVDSCQGLLIFGRNCGKIVPERWVETLCRSHGNADCRTARCTHITDL
jgi:hypothetical protein